MSKWRFILIKNMFLLTFKISNNFRTKNLQIEHSACHCTDACGIQRSFVVNFFVTRSKILDQSGLPSCARLSVEKKVFPEKKSLISKLFDFKIHKLVQNGTFGDELFEKQCFQYDHVMSLHGWWLWIWRWVEFNLKNLINSF